MILKRLSAIMMAAILATSSPVSAYLGEITAFAKKDDDEEDEKDYSVSDASWDTSEDSKGKTHVYATWTEAEDKSSGTITIYVDDKNRTSEAKKNGSITASTTSGKLELTSYIKNINRTGSYTFKITAGKKNKGDSEKSYAESDTLEVDSDFLKSLASSNSSGSSAITPNGNTSGSSGSNTASGATPADAMKNDTQNSSQNSTQTPDQQAATADKWQLWQPYGWVYLENGIPVTNRWVFESDGKCYHLGANGFMDVNTYVSDELGTHYVGSDGALVQ